MRKLVVGFVFLFFFLGFTFSFGLAAEAQTTCLVYFTGIGCPHCAKTDPVILERLPKEHPDLRIIEYEIYQDPENAPLIDKYSDVYGLALGIPLIVFGKENFLVGDSPILENIGPMLEEQAGNPCPLVDGGSIDFNELDLASLPGKPKIYPDSLPETTGGETIPSELTLTKVLSLATVDAINPCALAVLILMLMAILAFAPKKRQNILLAGLAFTSAVFVMYFIYGLVIIRLFQLIQALTFIRLWLYRALGLGAIILGILNLKDFIRYKPGGFLTEMPMFLRPKAKSLFFKTTSPQGAFVTGALVTLFLLPCTIGPYVICGGILCSLSLLETIPWLLFYNLIFVLPMIAITIACYIGFTTVESVSGWKDKNIRYLHLVAGLIILGLGLAILLGWV